MRKCAIENNNKNDPFTFAFIVFNTVFFRANIIYLCNLQVIYGHNLADEDASVVLFSGGVLLPE